MKKLKVFSVSAILITFCCCILFSAPVLAASKKRSQFDHKPSGNIYYYDKKGHTVKGLVTIRGKKYYFNEKGIQQNGWQKINGNYYFFQIRNGSYAYMVTSQRVNGITLTKSGNPSFISSLCSSDGIPVLQYLSCSLLRFPVSWLLPVSLPL